MEPPTWTVVLRSVRTTGAVATWLLLPDVAPVPLLFPLPAIATSAPAATAPARAPAATVTTATCLAVSSAIDGRPLAAARPAARRGRLGDISAARINLLEEAGRGRGVGRFPGRPDLDRPRNGRAVDPPGRQAQLLAARLADLDDGRAVGVHAAALEVGGVPGWIGVVGDSAGPHAVHPLQVLGRVWRGLDRVGGPQLVPCLGQVLAARTGKLVQVPGRLGPLRDDDPDHRVGIHRRVGLLGIAAAALAGSPLVQQRRHVAGQTGRGAPAGGAAARRSGAASRGGAAPLTAACSRTSGRSEAGDLRRGA